MCNVHKEGNPNWMRDLHFYIRTISLYKYGMERREKMKKENNLEVFGKFFFRTLFGRSDECKKKVHPQTRRLKTVVNVGEKGGGGIS